jgi:subtilisin family serine protease
MFSEGREESSFASAALVHPPGLRMTLNHRNRPTFEALESRWLFAWSPYAHLVGQDAAASEFSGITGKGVTVAVVDTGIDYTQPSLGGGFGPGFKVIGGYDFYSNDADPMDGSGHGTSVAGVIAASPYTVNGITYQGVAPDAKLVALRVGTEDNIPNSNIEKALQWIIDNYKSYKIGVVNLSLGSGSFTDPQTSAQLSDEFSTLHADGIFVTAASGNSNDQSAGPIASDGVAYPAADPNVFAVGAVDSSDVITTWSQRGDELDLLAPGVNIVMPQRGGGFVTEDGTSFASPYVAGTAALIRQSDPTARSGDIGSILMGSGHNNRDGDLETGNTTTLQYSRLDIDSALRLTAQRVGTFTDINLGSNFDTALDSQGVLHAAYYNKGRLLYATRTTGGLWSQVQIVDDSADVGAMPSIAVDSTAKPGVGYFDLTNTSVKYANFTNDAWVNGTVESKKHVGWSPSLGYDIDGNAYLAYYRRSGGYLRLARLNRDAGTWGYTTIDGGGADDGRSLDLDVGEAAVRQGFGFTQYDTTVAIAYSDSTNGDLKYARLDVDDPAATWFVAVVDNTTGVSHIDLDLHAGPLGAGMLAAQIAYQNWTTGDVKYAYRNTDWFTETIAAGSPTAYLGDSVQLYFEDDVPEVMYYNRARRALYTASRIDNNEWSSARYTTSAAFMSITLNERTGDTLFTALNRPKTSMLSSELV